MFWKKDDLSLLYQRFTLSRTIFVVRKMNTNVKIYSEHKEHTRARFRERV